MSREAATEIVKARILCPTESLCRRFAPHWWRGVCDPRLAKPRPGLNSDRCFAAREWIHPSFAPAI